MSLIHLRLGLMYFIFSLTVFILLTNTRRQIFQKSQHYDESKVETKSNNTSTQKFTWRKRKDSEPKTVIPCCSMDSEAIITHEDICKEYSPIVQQEGDMLWQAVPDFGLIRANSQGCSCPWFVDGDDYIFEDYIPAWNTDTFCGLLDTGPLLMIGDSTTTNTFQALTGLLYTQNATCKRKIILGMSDTMIKIPTGLRNLGAKWSEYVRYFNPSFVVINFGAHVLNDPVITFNNILDELIQEHDHHFPGLPLLFRTQMPAGYGTFGHEVKNWTDYSMLRPVYNYNFFRTFDKIVHSKFNDLTKNRTILDISPLYQRPDMHPSHVNDNLHSCVNGPILDIFSRRLLMGMLQFEQNL